MTIRRHTSLLLFGMVASVMAMNVWASMNLALEKGCLNCHGTPPRGKTPTMATLAERYAAAKDNETEIARLAALLREHHLFGGVPAHERLTAAEAERLVRWLAAGGR